MSEGMTLEKAKAVLKRCEIVDLECNTPANAYLAGCASGFLEGVASRDPEVAELKERLGMNRMAWNAKQLELTNELSAEREAVAELKEEVQKWKEQGGMKENLLEMLFAEREASRKLVEAAKTGLLAAKRERTWFVRCLALAATKHPGDEKELAALDKLIEDIESVLKLYATPGHSPEGKTL